MSASRRAPGEAAPRAYSDLQRDIVTGRLDRDGSLAEGRLAERYGVSRTPIREALRRLEQEGLVERSARGFRIRRYTAEELYELYETRALLEGFAARCAAQRHGPVDVGRMTTAHDRFAAMGDDASVQARVAANRDFHTAVWLAAKNRTILEVLSRLHLTVVRHTTLDDPNRWRAARDEHAHIAEAILAGRDDDAERRMVAHLETGRDVALAAVQGFEAV